ncbi:draxin-A [Chanos chanos]|uniref:Draxin-A n=1 Tax=Chanos chanos TaxID=29144 RepID=A0A6J2UU79_CHACN|nr:draxin-A-like [Chanos chanos]
MARFIGQAFLLIVLFMAHSVESTDKMTKDTGTVHAPGDAINLPNSEVSDHQSGHGKRHARGKEKKSAAQLYERHRLPVIQAQDDWPEFEGLSPVHLEMDPEDQREKNIPKFEIVVLGQDNVSPGSEVTRKSRKQGNGRKTNRRHRTRVYHSKDFGLTVREREISVKQNTSKLSLRNPAESPMSPVVITGSSISLATTVASEEPSALSPPHTKLQGRKAEEEVMPTLNMALFDWTDYEDMRPRPKNKDKQHTKSLNQGHMTMNSKTVELCDHHVDCMPGSCCNLRKHTCELHNHGLNNKCYDDCMCEEGLRCYARFHRNHRVTRKKGRCIDPDTVNSDHGTFFTI